MSEDVLKALEAKFMGWEPQARARAVGAVASLREGLAELAKLGETLHVGTGPGALQAVQDFPMMLYHSSLGQVVVQDLAEFEAKLEQGWDVHPSLVKPKPSESVPGAPEAPAKVEEDT